MRIPVFIICFIFYCFINTVAVAQSIVGVVIDKNTHKPINNVNIENTNNGFAMLSDEFGKFFIGALRGQLLIFSKPGYKTVRVRIPDGYIPEYFKIIMQDGPVEIPPYDIDNKYKLDSLRYRNLYNHELDFARMSTLQVIEHPFSAMSRKSREIWAFQDDYHETEKQKYVDYMFSGKTITQLTGLTGDSLVYYMRRYRPTYEQVRNMNEYSFYTYIKRSADLYRARSKPQPFRTSH